MKNTDAKTNLVLAKGYFGKANLVLQILSIWVCQSYNPVIFSYSWRGLPHYLWIHTLMIFKAFTDLWKEKIKSLIRSNIFYKIRSTVFSHINCLNKTTRCKEKLTQQRRIICYSLHAIATSYHWWEGAT